MSLGDDSGVSTWRMTSVFSHGKVNLLGAAAQGLGAASAQRYPELLIGFTMCK